MARSGDLAGVKREIQALQELRSAPSRRASLNWADRTQEQTLPSPPGGRTRRVRATATKLSARSRRRRWQRQARGDGDRLYPMRDCS